MAQLDLQLFGGNLIIEDIKEVAIQELDILFNTEETELLGDYNYGVNFEQFLWTLQPSAEEVNNYLKNKINKYTCFCKNLNITVNTQIEAGTIRDIYIINISLHDNNETISLKNYIFR